MKLDAGLMLKGGDRILEIYHKVQRGVGSKITLEKAQELYGEAKGLAEQIQREYDNYCYEQYDHFTRKISAEIHTQLLFFWRENNIVYPNVLVSTEYVGEEQIRVNFKKGDATKRVNFLMNKGERVTNVIIPDLRFNSEDSEVEMVVLKTAPFMLNAMDKETDFGKVFQKFLDTVKEYKSLRGSTRRTKERAQENLRGIEKLLNTHLAQQYCANLTLHQEVKYKGQRYIVNSLYKKGNKTISIRNSPKDTNIKIPKRVNVLDLYLHNVE